MSIWAIRSGKEARRGGLQAAALAVCLVLVGMVAAAPPAFGVAFGEGGGGGGGGGEAGVVEGGGGGGDELPLLVLPPSISGTPDIGNKLLCLPGEWRRNWPGFAYRWNRDGTAVSGATSNLYTVAATDAGSAITCTVTASSRIGSVSATSAALAVAGAMHTTGPGGGGGDQAPDEVVPEPSGPGLTPGGGSDGLRGGDACRSRRRFTIRIPAFGGAELRSVWVAVNGAPVRVSRRADGRFVARVDLIGRRSGIYVVSIRGITVNGTRVSATRRYRTCTRRRPPARRGARPRL